MTAKIDKLATKPTNQPLKRTDSAPLLHHYPSISGAVTSVILALVLLIGWVTSAYANPWSKVADSKVHKKTNPILMEAAEFAAKTPDPVARAVGIQKIIAPLIKTPVSKSMFLAKGPVHTKLLPAVVLWMDLAKILMDTPNRALRVLAHDLMREQERLRARCRHAAARALSRVRKQPESERRNAAWTALSQSRVTCGHTRLSTIAHTTKGNEKPLRTALIAWPGLQQFCPGIDKVLKDIDQWPKPNQSLAVDRRCRPNGMDAKDIKSQPVMAVTWTYALAQWLGQNNLLTHAHKKLLLIARNP